MKDVVGKLSMTFLLVVVTLANLDAQYMSLQAASEVPISSGSKQATDIVPPSLQATSQQKSAPLSVTFKLISVSGPIRYQLPLSAEWKKAKKGFYIPDGSILMVPDNSKITVEAQDALGREGIFVKSTKVTINEPMIVRLSRDSFRRVKVEAEMKARLPDEKAMKALAKMAKAEDSLLDAWKSMANSVLDKEPPDDQLAKMLEDAQKQARPKDAVMVSSKAGKIVIRAPREGETKIVKVLPTDVRVQWERDGLRSENDRNAYDVFFWKDNSPQNVYARVKGTTLVINALSFGGYNLQVVSADGAYKSKVRKIMIEDQLKQTDQDDGLPGDDKDVQKALSQRIKALSPGRNIVWQGIGKWPLIGFEWSRPDICSDQVLYRLLVKNNDGKVILKRDVPREQFFWEPASNVIGSLVWQIEGLSCLSAKKEKVTTLSTTPPRMITLIRGSGSSALSRATSEPKFRGTIVLDSL